MRHRAWGLLLVVPVVLFAAVSLLAPFPGFHQHLQFAGAPDRFVETVVRAGRSDARSSLWLDNVFVIAWLVVVPRLLRAGVQRWAPERRRAFGWWRAAPTCAVAAAVLDLVGNVLSLWMVGKESPPTVVLLALSTVSWLMITLYAAAIVGLFGLVIGPLTAPVVRPAIRAIFRPFDGLAGAHVEMAAPESSGDETPGAGATADAPDQDTEARERIAICLSGGGVRAASVSIGALRALDEADDDGPTLFRRATWLSAVSGGAYAAGGWRISRRPAGEIAPRQTDTRDGLFDRDGPWSATVRRRRRFLDNGRGSLIGGVIGMLARSVAVFVGVLAATYVAARLIGLAVQTHAIHPDFPLAEDLGGLLTLRDLIPLRLVLPGGIALALATAVALTAYSRPDPDARTSAMRLARLVAVYGAAVTGLLVAVPIGIVYGRKVLNSLPGLTHADEGAGVLGVLSAIGVIGAITGVAVAELKRRWMRLGGVFLAIGLFLFAGKVADAAARGLDAGWATWAIPGTTVDVPVAVFALVWLGLLDSIASHRLTLGGVYRKRLAATFALADGDRPPLAPLAYGKEPKWQAYQGADGPELVIAATAHASAITFGGLPAYGFTFRPDRVTLFDRTDGTSATVQMEAYPTGSWWDGFPRGWIVSRSMALSGAAIASAMGRQALGTTNALLVAVNLRLGAWVPNPRYAHWFADPADAPRVHLGYLLKELTNRYHPERDAFVYVADGGHRENLGLVEILRERPDVVICIDASGDRPGSFQTLSEAIELALVELHIDIDIDLDRLRPQGGDRPALDCVAEGEIRYPEALGGGTARLLYGRSQLSEEASADLLQFGGANPRFPSYSTADQFLTESEHDQLVFLGELIGARIRGLFGGSAPSIRGRV